MKDQNNLIQYTIRFGYVGNLIYPFIKGKNKRDKMKKTASKIMKLKHNKAVGWYIKDLDQTSNAINRIKSTYKKAGGDKLIDTGNGGFLKKLKSLYKLKTYKGLANKNNYKTLVKRQVMMRTGKEMAKKPGFILTKFIPDPITGTPGGLPGSTLLSPFINKGLEGLTKSRKLIHKK